MRWLLGALIAVGLFITPQQAAAQCDCPSNRLCLWRDVNYTGALKSFTRDDADHNWSDNYFPGGSVDISDEVSSVWNNTNHWVALYRHHIGAWLNMADFLCVAPGVKIWFLNAIPSTPDFNDSFSGHEWGVTQNDVASRYCSQWFVTSNVNP
jgi:hypothetical protein